MVSCRHGCTYLSRIWICLGCFPCLQCWGSASHTLVKHSSVRELGLIWNGDHVVASLKFSFTAHQQVRLGLALPSTWKGVLREIRSMIRSKDFPIEVKVLWATQNLLERECRSHYKLKLKAPTGSRVKSSDLIWLRKHVFWSIHILSVLKLWKMLRIIIHFSPTG